MKKIKKILLVLGIVCMSHFGFSFEIDDLEFGKNIKIGREEIKTFELRNNMLKEKRYKLYIEGDKNVNVTPKFITLNQLKNKTFQVKVKGKNTIGEHSYYLVIKEMNKNSENLNINKIVKIKQKYKITQ